MTKVIAAAGKETQATAQVKLFNLHIEGRTSIKDQPSGTVLSEMSYEVTKSEIKTLSRLDIPLPGSDTRYQSLREENGNVIYEVVYAYTNKALFGRRYSIKVDKDGINPAVNQIGRTQKIIKTEQLNSLAMSPLVS